MGRQAALPAAPSKSRPIGSRTAERNDLVVMVVAVIAALLLDLAIFAFLTTH